MEKLKQKIIELMKADNYIEALIYCGKILRFNPNDTEILDKALFIHKRIIDANEEMKAETAEEYTDRGIALFYLNHYEDAINDLNAAIELDVNFDYAWKTRSLVYFISSKFNLAERDIRKAIEINPTAEYFHDLGNILSSKNSKDYESIDCFKKATELNPTSEYYWNDYALDLGEKGKIQESLNAFNKALEINPNYEDAKVNFDYLLKIMKKSK